VCMHVEASLPVPDRVRLEHAPGTHDSFPRTTMLVGNPTALLCSMWGVLFVGSPTAACGIHGDICILVCVCVCERERVKQIVQRGLDYELFAKACVYSRVYVQSVGFEVIFVID